MAQIASIQAKLDSNSPFTIKEVPGKGLGAFATRDITPGELILAEESLLRIRNPLYLAADVEAEYNKLSDEKKRVYMSLASAHGQDPGRYPSSISPDVETRERKRIMEQHGARTAGEKSILSVCMTNAMQTSEGAGIFEMASRFNHDCVPNGCFAWCEERGVETIYANRYIAEGEEITLSYCDPTYDVSMRKWELMHYDFECKCRACTNFDKAGTFAQESRERRWKLRELEKEVYLCGSDAEQLVNRLDVVGLMREEGLCNPSLAYVYLEVARICERCGDSAMAVKAARKAVEVYTICLGGESEKAVEAKKSLRAFEKG